MLSGSEKIKPKKLLFLWKSEMIFDTGQIWMCVKNLLFGKNPFPWHGCVILNSEILFGSILCGILAGDSVACAFKSRFPGIL